MNKHGKFQQRMESLSNQVYTKPWISHWIQVTVHQACQKKWPRNANEF
jgi:hypothetical protein